MVVKEFKHYCAEKPLAACIGYFDSIHLGHQQLIAAASNFAKLNDCIPTVITFDRDPAEVIGGKEVKQFNTFEKRLKRFSELGIELVLLIGFDRDMAKLAPEVFINDYLCSLNIQYLVCGFDFSYGFAGKGDVSLLTKLCPFRIEVIGEYKVYDRKVATSWLKECVEVADFRTIERLLGSPYTLLVDFDKAEIIAENKLILPPEGRYQISIDNQIFWLELKDSKAVLNDRNINGVHEVVFR